MSATPAQIAHIKANQALFDELRVEKNADVDAYFQEYSYIDDLYERVCSDLGIEPIVDTSALEDQARELGEQAREIQRLLLEMKGYPRGTYHNPTDESLAAEVTEERRVRDEYEANRVREMITELESLGYTVTKGR
jgi:hypothetical protein